MTTTAKETDRPDNNLLGRLIGLIILIALYLIVCMWLRPMFTPAAAIPPTAAQLTAPTLNPLAAGLTAGPVTLTGTGTPGSQVQIVLDGQPLGRVAVGPDGRWTFPLELAAGKRNIVAQAITDSGSVAASSQPLRVTVGAAPAAITAPTLDPVAANAVAGPLTLTGTGAPGSTVQIVIDGRVVGEATVGADGKWSFPTTLAAGDHRLVVNALDAAGQVVATAPAFNFKLGEALSTPTLDPLPSGAVAGPLTLTGTGAPGSKVQIVIGGQPAGEATVGADGKWSFAVTLPNTGVVPVSVNALDANGQVTASGPSIDLNVAALTLDPLAASYRPGPATLTGAGAPGSRVRLVIDGQPAGEATVGADGKWTFAATFVRAGNYTVAVSALDANGQVVATSNPATARVQAAAAAPAPSLICDYSDPTVYGEDQGTTWLVDRCDTLSYIARQTGIPLDALIAANPQIRNPDLILPGWRVNLPGR